MGSGNSVPKISPDEMMQINKRKINKLVRELDRERNKLLQEEKKAIVEIKKLADKGQMDSVNALAKSILRMRAHQKHFLQAKTTAQGVSLRLMTMKSTHQMSQTMKEFTKTVVRMNQQMDASQLQAVMREFMTEQEKQQMTQEMMDEAIDDAMGDDEAESDELVNQVLDELQIDLGNQLAGVPASKLPNGAPKEAAPAASTAEDDQLEARLAALRG